jgi:sulfide:quinone oxidoreductase
MVEQARITPFLSVSGQIRPEEVPALAQAGVKTIINNRPEGESDDQPASAELENAARAQGLAYIHQPVVSGQITDDDVAEFNRIFNEAQGPVHAFCRSGMRSISLWALSRAPHDSVNSVLQAAADHGYDLSGIRDRLEIHSGRASEVSAHKAGDPGGEAGYDVLIIGGGAGGLAAAASLLKRRPGLSVAVVEPRDKHYYQPAWTLVGGGVFDPADTEKSMASVIPKGCKWIRAAAAGFEPENNTVVLEDGERVQYGSLIVAPGLKLDWDAIEGLRDTLGSNGVTSNYRFDLAPYTWELVQNLRGGKALFTQPPMPIKCAGAPQKAMYLSCDHWLRQGVLDTIDVEFNNAGGVLFGVETFVPPLMEYVRKYGIDLAFKHNLVKVDGPAQKAWFEVTDDQGQVSTVEKDFDMLHVCPPQTAPDFIRDSPLANEAGWVDVNQQTLRHPKYGNIFALGDVSGSPNAKTAAAVRKQAPVVAENLLATLDAQQPDALYDGYGSCPLTVEKGKVVLAEFGYGGKLLPTFPLRPDVPRRSMWLLKEKLMPSIYFKLMLRGHEWLVNTGHGPPDNQ